MTDKLTGTWHELNEYDDWECSNCGHVYQVIGNTPEGNDMHYCMYCGARLTKEGDG